MILILVYTPKLESRWLGLKEAAEYSHIGVNRLIGLARSGIVRGFQDPDSKRGDWIFDRESLDNYRLSQSTNETADERALDILGSIPHV